MHSLRIIIAKLLGLIDFSVSVVLVDIPHADGLAYGITSVENLSPFSFLLIPQCGIRLSLVRVSEVRKYKTDIRYVSVLRQEVLS